jgi:hypothetical protein
MFHPACPSSPAPRHLTRSMHSLLSIAAIPVRQSCGRPSVGQRSDSGILAEIQPFPCFLRERKILADNATPRHQTQSSPIKPNQGREDNLGPRGAPNSDLIHRPLPHQSNHPIIHSPMNPQLQLSSIPLAGAEDNLEPCAAQIPHQLPPAAALVLPATPIWCPTIQQSPTPRLPHSKRVRHL